MVRQRRLGDRPLPGRGHPPARGPRDRRLASRPVRALAHLREWELFKCARPGFWDPWEDGEQLELPIHQVLVRPSGSGPPPEAWEPQPEEIQFFLNEVEDGVWLCRRDTRVTRPADELAIGSASGIPIIAPEIQLLYKAKHHLDKDEHDFRVTLARLSGEQRAWLREALTIAHPDDPWLEQLD